MSAGAGEGARISEVGPALSITDLREFLRDLTDENEFLNEQECSSELLIKARGLPIEQWNATLPRDGIPKYTADTFPEDYLYYWRTAAAAEALRMVGFRYLRNIFPYRSGGITVQDKETKAKAYLELSTVLRQEWLIWLVQEKKAQTDARMRWKIG